jgi:hypothetical protein
MALFRRLEVSLLYHERELSNFETTMARSKDLGLVYWV